MQAIIAFHSSLPITYFLPNRSAAYFTIPISQFASFIRSPMLFPPSTVTPLSICILQLLLYNSLPSSIYVFRLRHLCTPPSHSPLSHIRSIITTCSIITFMSSLLAIRHTSSAYRNPAWLFHFRTIHTERGDHCVYSWWAGNAEGDIYNIAPIA